MAVVDALQSWVLPADGRWSRDPSEISLDNRRDDFDEHFDRTTLVYHAFDDGERVRLFAHKPMNLEPVLSTLAAVDGDRRLALGRREYLRHVELRAEVTGVSSLWVDGDAGSHTFDLTSTLADRFTGLDTIVTLSKDNPLDWIADVVGALCAVAAVGLLGTLRSKEREFGSSRKQR